MASQSKVPPRTIVIGLGNPIFGDDGLGWMVAQQIEAQIESPEIDVIWLARGGLYLMERMIGYERAILIDALHHTEADPGEIFQFTLDSLPPSGTGHSYSSHDTTLTEALKMGKSLGLELPEELMVVAVASPWVTDFKEEISAPIQAAIPRARDIVLEWLGAPAGSSKEESRRPARAPSTASSAKGMEQ